MAILDLFKLRRRSGRDTDEGPGVTKEFSTVYPRVRPYRSPGGGRREQGIPDSVARFYVPLPVLKATSRFMQRFGDERRECYVWWGGYFTRAGEGQVVTALCPEIPTSYGHISLGVRELGALHSRLRELDQVLVAELHSHPPGAGGQNDVDAAHPAAPYPGFISIVVPDFAYPHLYDLRDTYVYEYLEANHWRELASSEIKERFVVEEASVTVRSP